MTELADLGELDGAEAVYGSGCLHPAHLHPGVGLGVQLVDLVTVLVTIIISSCNY